MNAWGLIFEKFQDDNTTKDDDTMTGEVFEKFDLTRVLRIISCGEVSMGKLVHHYSNTSR